MPHISLEYILSPAADLCFPLPGCGRHRAGSLVSKGRYLIPAPDTKHILSQYLPRTQLCHSWMGLAAPNPPHSPPGPEPQAGALPPTPVDFTSFLSEGDPAPQGQDSQHAQWPPVPVNRSRCEIATPRCSIGPLLTLNTCPISSNTVTCCEAGGRRAPFS